MTPYERAVWRDPAEKVRDAMARAAREALAHECAGAPDAVTKHVFGAAVVAMIADLDEARLARAIGAALAGARP